MKRKTITIAVSTMLVTFLVLASTLAYTTMLGNSIISNAKSRLASLINDEISTVKIGTQTWCAKNLDVSTYRNGDTILQVQDALVWSQLKTGAWCYYQNKTENGVIYGKLYNWYAVSDSRGIAPTGFHVASDAEWTTLTKYLGGGAADKLKETGTIHWKNTSLFTTNSSAFSALPGGCQISSGQFAGICYQGYWWTSTEDNTNNSWSRWLDYKSGDVYRISPIDKRSGFSVRCIKD